MQQVTLRMDERLANFLKQAAAARSESVNSYARTVLSAAVDPEYAGDEAEQLRERLARAGLLATPKRGTSPRPDPAAVAAAGKRAARGRTLSSIIVEDRG
jgi:plasmid stability protein